MTAVAPETLAVAERSRPSIRRRHALAWAAGSAVALVIFSWLVTGGSGDLLARDIAGDFHDQQARALLDGHWDVDPEVVTIEGFAIDGRTYIYFGPAPALLRMPLLAVTDAFDGRLTRVSLIVAFIVALAASGVLAWRVRQLVRADEPLDRAERVLVAGTAVLIGSGSVLVFYAGRAWVYHESSLWAIAFALAAFAALLGYQGDRRGRSLLLAGFFTAAALLSRGSIGIGPAAAIGIIAAVEVVAVVRRRRSATRADLVRVVALGCALLLPVAVYSTVNRAKFGSAFALPLDRQVQTMVATPGGAGRRAALAANNGSLFGAQYLPTTVLQYTRPDGIELQRLFPWVRFPAPADVVGDVTFDTVDPSASVSATSPALVLLAVVGLVGVARRRRLRSLVTLLAGGAVGAMTILAFGAIAHRYTGDLLPVLIVLAVSGLAVLPSLPARAWVGRAVLVGATILTAWSVWVNTALTLDYQRFTSPNADDRGRAALVEWQVAIGPRAAFDVQRGPDLGAVGPSGQFFVVGECDGLYRSNGDAWEPIERTPRTGHLRVRASITRMPPGTVLPLALLTGSSPAFAPVSLRWLDDGRVMFEAADQAGLRSTGATVDPGDASHLVEVVADTRTTETSVSFDGDPVVHRLHFQALPRGELVAAPGWAGTIEPAAMPTPSCDELSQGPS